MVISAEVCVNFCDDCLEMMVMYSMFDASSWLCSIEEVHLCKLIVSMMGFCIQIL